MSLALRIIDRLPISRERSLLWQENALDRLYRREIRAARTKGDYDEVHSLEGQHQAELELLSQEFDVIYTSKLVRKARRLRVPVPSHEESGFWKQASQLGKWHLTETGYVTIRDAIRKEEIWRREQHAHRIALLSTVIGILGALTGLAAIILK